MKREMIWGLILQDVIPVPGNLRQAKPWMAYVMWSETRTCTRMLSKKNYRVLMNIYVRHELCKIQNVNGVQMSCHGGGSMPNRNGILSIYFRFSSKASSFLYWLFWWHWILVSAKLVPRMSRRFVPMTTERATMDRDMLGFVLFW